MSPKPVHAILTSKVSTTKNNPMKKTPLDYKTRERNQRGLFLLFGQILPNTNFLCLSHTKVFNSIILSQYSWNNEAALPWRRLSVSTGSKCTVVSHTFDWLTFSIMLTQTTKLDFTKEFWKAMVCTTKFCSTKGFHHCTASFLHLDLRNAVFDSQE